MQGLRNDSSVTEELDLPNGCKLGAEGLKHSEKGIDILPTPVFVVKTRDKGTGQKVLHCIDKISAFCVIVHFMP